MRRKIVAVLVTAGMLALGLLIAPAVSVGTSAVQVTTEEGTTGTLQVPVNVFGEQVAAADAGTCSAPGVCGRIHNRSDRTNWIHYTHPYQNYPGDRNIWPGQNSETYGADADGFYIDGCVRLFKYDPTNGYWDYGRKYTGHHKVTDNVGPGWWETRRC